MDLDQFLRRIGPAALRYFMAGVFFWFGFTQLLNSQGWVSFLPEFLQKNLVDPTWFIFLNGSMEIILGTFLVFGFYSRLSALILGGHLLGIAWTVGLNTSIGVRDIGLGLATMTIFFNGPDSFSLDRFLINKKAQVAESIFFIAIYAVIATLALGLLAGSFQLYRTHKELPLLQNVDNNLQPETVGINGSSNSVPLTGFSQPPVALSVQVVAGHNRQTDCWIIISNKVYNVTSYIYVHPGGADRILNQCGKESTQMFQTKGNTGSTHSASAIKILASFLVGNIGTILPNLGSNPQGSNSPGSPTPATNNPLPPTPPAITPTVTPPVLPPVSVPSTGLTMVDVARYSSVSNCWLVISSKVYNVTPYIPFHPGGQDRIISNCGTDATQAFSTKGGTGSTHSLSAQNILAGYFVGNLSSSTNPPPPPPPVPTTDVIGPNVVIISPPNGSTVSGVVAIQATATDSSGVASVQFLIDSLTLGTATSLPYSASLNTANYSNSTHTIQAVARDIKNNTQTTSITLSINNAVAPPPPAPPLTSGGITATQVLAHNSVSNCWLIISGRVYNVTSYIPVHPGGQSRIISNCGMDATTAFNTRGGTGSHSTNAHNILAGFYIGDLTTSTNTTPPPSPTPTPSPTPSGTPATYNVSVTSSGTISPSSLIIHTGDSVRFTYTNPADEITLTFSPQPPSSMKLDHEFTTKTYTFTNTGTYTYHRSGSSINATIIVQ